MKKEPSCEYGKFTISEHEFKCFMPNNNQEENYWLVVITKDSIEVRREKLNMMYRPFFGADVEDVQALNELIEKIIKEMNLD